MIALWFQSRHNLVLGLFSVMRNIAIRHAISPLSISYPRSVLLRHLIPLRRSRPQSVLLHAPSSDLQNYAEWADQCTWTVKKKDVKECIKDPAFLCSDAGPYDRRLLSCLSRTKLVRSHKTGNVICTELPIYTAVGTRYFSTYRLQPSSNTKPDTREILNLRRRYIPYKVNLSFFRNTIGFCIVSRLMSKRLATSTSKIW